MENVLDLVALNLSIYGKTKTLIHLIVFRTVLSPFST